MKAYTDFCARAETLYFIIKSTGNWLTIILNRLMKTEAVAQFRNGYSVPVTNANWNDYILHAHLFARLPSAKLDQDTLTFDYQGRRLSMKFGRYGFSTIYEIFAFDPYDDFMKKLDIRGLDVIDIGAAFGDTAIYFLFKGARTVIGYEAFPGYFDCAARNIANNGFSEVCTVKLCAVGGRTGNLKVDTDSTDMFGTNVGEAVEGESVPVITLEEVVMQDNIDDALLKLDTEGYEYEILFNSSQETIRKFKYMLIEYHYGYGDIEKFLAECGYEYFHTGPTDVYVPHLVDEHSRHMKTGHVVATRID